MELYYAYKNKTVSKYRSFNIKPISDHILPNPSNKFTSLPVGRLDGNKSNRITKCCNIIQLIEYVNLLILNRLDAVLFELICFGMKCNKGNTCSHLLYNKLCFSLEKTGVHHTDRGHLEVMSGRVSGGHQYRWSGQGSSPKTGVPTALCINKPHTDLNSISVGVYL